MAIIARKHPHFPIGVSGAGGITVHFVNGRMVISTTPELNQAIESLLGIITPPPDTGDVLLWDGIGWNPTALNGEAIPYTEVDVANVKEALDFLFANSATFSDSLVGLSQIDPTAGTIIYATDTNVFAFTGLSEFMRGHLANANPAAARNTLELGTLATLDSVFSVHISGGSVTASKRAVADHSNIYPDPGFMDVPFYSGGDFTLENNSGSGVSGSDLRELTIAPDADDIEIFSAWFPIDPSTDYTASMLVYRVAGAETGSVTVELQLGSMDEAGAVTLTTSSALVTAHSLTTASAWANRQSTSIATGASDRRARWRFVLIGGGTATARFGKPIIRRVPESSDFIAKDAVETATTANITLSGEQTIDGVLTSTSRILVKNQSAPAENGIYVTAAGAWSRATDMDAWDEVPKARVFVSGGTTQESTVWFCTSPAGGTLDTDPITWVQLSASESYTAGTGLTLAGNEFAVSDPELLAVSGLTSAADKLPYFTGSGTAGLADFPSFGRSIAASTSAAVARGTIGAGSVSVADFNASPSASGPDNVTAYQNTINSLPTTANSTHYILVPAGTYAGDFSTLTVSDNRCIVFVNLGRVIYSGTAPRGESIFTSHISGGSSRPAFDGQYVFKHTTSLSAPNANVGQPNILVDRTSDNNSGTTGNQGIIVFSRSAEGFTGITRGISSTSTIDSTAVAGGTGTVAGTFACDRLAIPAGGSGVGTAFGLDIGARDQTGRKSSVAGGITAMEIGPHASGVDDEDRRFGIRLNCKGLDTVLETTDAYFHVGIKIGNNKTTNTQAWWHRGVWISPKLTDGGCLVGAQFDDCHEDAVLINTPRGNGINIQAISNQSGGTKDGVAYAAKRLDRGIYINARPLIAHADFESISTVITRRKRDNNGNGIAISEENIYANNASSAETLYASVRVVLANNTAGSERGSYQIHTQTGGTLTNQLTVNNGVIVGNPTGGSKGVGNINVEGDVWQNNTQYTNPDYAFEHYFTGKIEKFAQNEGASDYPGLMPLDALEAYTRENWRLPRITDEPAGMFKRGNIVLEKTEEILLYLFEINKRLKAVEGDE